MMVHFFMKEESSVQEDSITISVMRKRTDKRSQVMNAIPMEKMSHSDRQVINAALALLERYSNEQSGAIEVNYSL